MSHFAEVDTQNKVLRVIVADDIAWCQSRLGGTWIQTSYRRLSRGNYAGIGYGYHPEHDLFMPKRPARDVATGRDYEIDTATARWVLR